MSLNFLETSLRLDASGVGIGTSGTLTASLTLDQRSSGAASFTAVSANDDATVPFSVSLTKVNSQLCTLTLTFDKSLSVVHFGQPVTITITDNLSQTYSLTVIIDYANDFVESNWDNSEELISISNIDLRGPFTSLSTNNRLRSLLMNALTGLNQIRNYIKYYSYKEKYLNDIIDFAIASGCSLESSTSTITTNSDGSINTIITSYATGRKRTEKIKITYTYATYTLKRLQLRSGIYNELTNESVSLLNSFRIDAIDNSGNVIYNLGVVSITRSSDYTIYSNPYVPDYVPSNSSIANDPVNLMSDYKYYKTYTTTGWTVVA